MSNAQRIENLRNEAANHGDTGQVALCDEALTGDEDSLITCLIVLFEAEREMDLLFGTAAT